MKLKFEKLEVESDKDISEISLIIKYEDKSESSEIIKTSEAPVEDNIIKGNIFDNEY